MSECKWDIEFYTTFSNMAGLNILFLLIVGLRSSQNAGLVYGEVVLSPSSPGTTENSPLTLTCTYTGDETVTTFTWKAHKKNETTFSNLGIITADCKPFIIPVDTNLYEYSCPSKKQYTWTIKKVTRQYEGMPYQCTVDTPSPGLINSNGVNISVQVAISSVELTTPNSSVITIKENTETVFKCKTSGGLPKATVTWFKSGGTSSQTGNELAINSQITTSSTTVNNLVEVTNTLRYSPSRNENGHRIFCKASNIVGQAPIVSRKAQLDVQYPPGDPIVIGFMNGGEYRVIENTVGYLSCSIPGGNPLPTLSWDCYNSGTSGVVSADTLTKGQIWTAERGKDKTCRCSSSHYSGTKSVSINVIILYPPTVPTFKIKKTYVSGTVNVIRNNPLSISCISSGNPLPSYTWTHPNSLYRHGQVLTIDNVQNDKRITCSVQNTLNPTDRAYVTRSDSSYIDVQVIYPPSTPTFDYWNTSGQSISTRSLSVIRGDTFKVACTSDGKPSPEYYWDNHGNNKILTITSINTDKTSSVCKAINTMRETVGQTLTRSSTASLTLNVQYPPTDVMLKYSNGDTLTNTLSVTEGKGFNVTCSSNSKPPPSYSWTGTVFSSSSILNVNSAIKSHTGTITCNVANVMIRTFANPEKEKSVKVDKSLDLQILYPPIIGELTKTSIKEGSPLTVSCPVTVGKPTQTSYQWLRDGAVWKRSQQFSIGTVTRTDAMTYTCKVSNTMIATGEKPVSSDVRKSFYLNVWYSATVKDFYISGHQGQTSVVKIENDKVRFNCLVDSNPGSNMSLTFIKDELKKQSGVQQLTHIIDSVTCTMRGNYSCEGFNEYNKKRSVKTIHLLVNCSPRPSPFITLNENVTSAQHVPAVLTFTTMAYPEMLEFKWYRWYSNLWQPLSNNDEFQIDTMNIQTNLTIKHVNRTYYGRYQLQVKNTVGNYTQSFYLKAEEKSAGGEIDSYCPCDNKSAIIVGCVLGIVITLLTVYATYITILFKRKSRNKEKMDINMASSGRKSGPTYANLSYPTAEGRKQESTETPNTVFQSSNSDTSEYMTLQNQFRDNKATYDIIDLKR